jgi:menaquinone-dependent protoporphyrinogen IX oxidase
MKGVIIYNGKYGATAQYAEWLSESLSLPIIAPENNTVQVEKSDFVIIGTSIYIGKFVMKDWIENNVAMLNDKKVFIFVVTGTPLDQQEKLNEYIHANIPQEIKNSSEIFFLPGRLSFKKLSWTDKLLVKVGAFFAKTPEEKKLMLTDYDSVRKEHLSELINMVKNYCKTKIKRTVVEFY